jgi:hypothetical protein
VKNGKYSRGLRLDGGAAARTEDDVLKFTYQLTISAWVYPHHVSGRQDIVRKWYVPDSYGLFIVDGNFVFSVAFPGGVTYDVSAPATKRHWTHVTGVFDGTGTTKSIKIYINGNNRHEKTFTGEHPLQENTRPLVVGGYTFRGRIDEVGLYDAAFTDGEVENLASRDKSFYFGADSFVYLKTRPDGEWVGDCFSAEEMGYDFYGGRLGRWFEAAPQGSQACRITDRWGNDVITGGPVPADQRCAFIYEAALMARPERTYGFWWMAGPDHDDARRFKRPGKSLSGFGRAQASGANSQWKTYNHVVGGRTLFADVERCIDLPGKKPEDPRIPCTVENDTARWAQCEPSESRPNACKDNQAVLEGFLKGVAELGLTPGVYTGAERWKEFFGENYVPTDGSGEPIPFVLWLAGFDITTNDDNGGPRFPGEVEEAFPAAEATGLGGMRTVIWQHHIKRPDWDGMQQNPSRGFVPQPTAVLPPPSVLTPTDDHGHLANPCPAGDDGYFISNTVFEYSTPGKCFPYWEWLWRLEQERTSGGPKYFHVKVKYVSGPGDPVQIYVGEILSSPWRGVYGPDYSTGTWPQTISIGQTVDIGTISPDGFPGTQHDGYFTLAITPVEGPYPAAGLYRFEITKIYAMDVFTGAITVIYP